jgi:hypothetical protein
MKRVLGSALFTLAITTAALAQPTGADPATPTNPPGSDEIVLNFRGTIDGSDQITITRKQAIWRHSYWDLPPEPLTLNGISWDPRGQATLKNSGKTRFLPHPVEFQSARLNRIQGRDTVALEANRDSVVVHLSDTPNGASLYEFQVILRRRDVNVAGRKPARTPRATLRVVAEIDGSDELHLDAREARWVHRHWDWPGEVRLTQVAWDPRESPTLKNEGETRFLDSPVDFATARMTRQDGRDTAVLEHTDGGLVIYFADSPPGRSSYDLLIRFGE